MRKLDADPNRVDNHAETGHASTRLGLQYHPRRKARTVQVIDPQP